MWRGLKQTTTRFLPWPVTLTNHASDGSFEYNQEKVTFQLILSFLSRKLHTYDDEPCTEASSDRCNNSLTSHFQKKFHPESFKCSFVHAFTTVANSCLLMIKFKMETFSHIHKYISTYIYIYTYDVNLIL